MVGALQDRTSHATHKGPSTSNLCHRLLPPPPQTHVGMRIFVSIKMRRAVAAPQGETAILAPGQHISEGGEKTTRNNKKKRSGTVPLGTMRGVCIST